MEARCLGLIGGLGVGATVHYYRRIVAAHEARGRVPRLTIAHADTGRVYALAGARDFDGLARYLAAFIKDMAAGGAEFAAMVAATPHLCTPQLTAISPLPLIDMLDEVAAAVRARGLTRVALLGTRFTVESRFFGRLEGVETVMPRADELELIHTVYSRLVAGKASPAEIDQLKTLGRTFVARDGAEAVLLAGTDLATVMDAAALDFPAVDCAQVHIDAIVQKMLG